MTARHTVPETDTFRIRPARREDAGAILDIYAHYVLHTAVSYEYEVPSLPEFQARMDRTLEKYPYFVAVRDGTVLGYAYAGPFVGRAAYDWSAEVTIYLAPDKRRQGIGRALYETLEAALADMGIRNLYACIGWPEPEDEYLTRDSAAFHARLGYVTVGTFRKCGRKFGRWYDMIWLEKLIGPHPAEQAPVRPYGR